MVKCDCCHKLRPYTKTAVVSGVYYPNICMQCLGNNGVSSSSAGYERRRQYEDNAEDTVQPYDATGAPRAEFYRLYPEAAGKVFTPSEIEQVKRKI